MTASADLIAGHPDRWLAATRSPFLDAAGDGTLDDGAFDRWLAQDHLYVTALVRAWGCRRGPTSPPARLPSPATSRTGPTRTSCTPPTTRPAFWRMVEGG